MSPEGRYLALRQTFFKTAASLAGSDLSLRDELLSVADLAFVQALDRHETSKLPLDDWVCLCVRNAMLNFVKGERRRRRWLYLCADMDSIQCPLDRLASRLAGLSGDAQHAALAIASSNWSEGREYLLNTIGWRRNFYAIEELKRELIGE